MSIRTNALAAFASLSLLAIGWGITQPLAQASNDDVPSASSGTTTDPDASAGGPSDEESGQQSSPDPQSSGSDTESTTDAATYADGTYTGSVTSNEFGQWQVSVTIAGGQITDVQAQTSANDHHSERINQQAVPMLREEVLEAHSADVDFVSGATLTSDSYLTSLQSALDEARQ